jgi:hypothetical protein
MDPLTLMMLSQLANGGGGGMQPGFDTTPMPAPADPALGGGSPTDLAGMMGAIKAPEAPKPIMSGGVSGSSLPFLQGMPNTLGPALSGASERIFNQPQMPSLGQLIGGR